MEIQLIPRLQEIYNDLHERNAVALETEAVVSALIDELEDVNDSVEMAKSSSSPNQDVDGHESLLEAEMVDLLKELLGACFVLMLGPLGADYRYSEQQRGKCGPP